MLALVWWILDKVLDHMWSIWVGTTFPTSTILAVYSQAVTLVMSGMTTMPTVPGQSLLNDFALNVISCQ